MSYSVDLGPLNISSGILPTNILGPSQDNYVVEHLTPQKLNPHMEYIGFRQPRQQIRGFFAPTGDARDSPAGGILSGAGFFVADADDMREELINMRASGLQLLRIRSADGSGHIYNNEWYCITNISMAFAAAKAYPYYPYTINLLRATPRAFGNNSGTADWTAGFSGFIRSWQLVSGQTTIEYDVVGLGMLVDIVTSGNAKMAVYDSGNALVVETSVQVVYSGWNFWQLRPGFTAVSGHQYKIAVKADIESGNAFHMQYLATSIGSSGREQSESGITFSDNFPTTYTPLTAVSGRAFTTLMVGNP